MSTFVVGDLVWKLVVDPTPLNQNLAKTATALKKQEKEMGGILGFLGSKWSFLAGAAIGASYAMIRASPSLSFAMEEMTFRFNELFMILGEQFAPLIEDIIIPILDAFIPIVEEFAPMIGEAMGEFVEFFQSPEIQEALGGVLTALTNVADSVLDVLEPALDIMWNILEIVGPPIIEAFSKYLGGVTTALDDLAIFIQWIADLLDPHFYNAVESVTGIIGGFIDFLIWLQDIFNINITKALENILPHISGFRWALEAVGSYLGSEYGLIWWIKFMGGYLEKGFVDALDIAGAKLGWLKGEFDIVDDRVQFLIDSLKQLNEILEKLFAPPETIPYEGPAFPSLPSLIGLLGGLQAGGMVPRTGPYLLHAGEYVVPSHQTQNFQTQEITVNIIFETVQISSDYDITRLAENVSREIKRELGMLF